MNKRLLTRVERHKFDGKLSKKWNSVRKDEKVAMNEKNAAFIELTKRVVNNRRKKSRGLNKGNERKKKTIVGVLKIKKKRVDE